MPTMSAVLLAPARRPASAMGAGSVWWLGEQRSALSLCLCPDAVSYRPFCAWHHKCSVQPALWRKHRSKLVLTALGCWESRRGWRVARPCSSRRKTVQGATALLPAAASEGLHSRRSHCHLIQELSLLYTYLLLFYTLEYHTLKSIWSQ